MKVAGNGQAKILAPVELKLLFTEGFTRERDRALFGICLFTGCRISEALELKDSDIKGKMLTFRKSTTKGQLNTRQVLLHPELVNLLNQYQLKKAGYLFPGKQGVRERLNRCTADKILKTACSRVGIAGVSTHSFRRTALTQMSNAGIPLRHIQQISGHTNLNELSRYLEVTDEQADLAVKAIHF